ncbi:MAG: outer membrane beta-barrel protein [Alphaproteobacteria bacterium]|nr:outer membrane beta-barrel protein [Alphaproteobacteria bacterium]
MAALRAHRRALRHRQAGERRRAALAAGLVLLVGHSASTAWAEDGTDVIRSLERPKNVAVKDRSHPEYTPKGIRLGSFVASPRYAATGSWTDNLLATPSNKIDDYALKQSLSLALATNWSRHAASAAVGLDTANYLDNSREDSTRARARASLRLDLTSGLSVETRGGYAQFVEARTEATSRSLQPREPIEFAQTDVSVVATERMPRMRLTLAGQYVQYDYEDAVDAAGARIDQAYRDRSVFTVSARDEIAVSPDMYLLVEGSANWRQFDEMPAAGPKRDSTGYDLLLGAGFALSDSARGELALGYYEQSFDASSLGTESGLAMRGEAEWYLTQLMTLSARIGRTVNDADLTDSARRVSTFYSASLDYEFLRNLVLSWTYRYGTDSFSSIDRDDRIHGFSSSLAWQLNRNMEVDGRYAYDHSDSTGTAAGSDYRINSVSATWRLRF